MPGGCADEGFDGAFPSGSWAAATQAAHGKTAFSIFYLMRQLLSYLKYRELDQRGVFKTTTTKSRNHSILKKGSPESPQSNAVVLAPFGTSPCTLTGIPKLLLRCFPGSSHSSAVGKAHGPLGGQRNQGKKSGPDQAYPSVPPHPSGEGTDLYLGSQGRGFVEFFGIGGALYFS